MNARWCSTCLLVLLLFAGALIPASARSSESVPIALAASDASTCALDAAGSVECWGSDAWGELGDGEPFQTRYAAVPVANLGPVSAIGAGLNHNCAVQKDGLVKCWGSNPSGQFGDGSTGYSLVPVTMQIADATQVEGGYGHTCVLVEDGSVRCAGSNSVMQMGTGSASAPQTTPVEVSGLDDVVQIAVGFVFACALKTDATVWCWGGDDFGQTGADPQTQVFCYNAYSLWCTPAPVRVEGLPPVTHITAGSVHACAVTVSREVWCWGRNQTGQLYTPPTIVQESWTPVRMPLVDIASADAGNGFTCAVGTAGTTWCWGRNTYGQHGNGTCCGMHFLPALFAGGVTLSAGGSHVCAISRADETYCWGANHSRQLGYRTDPLTWSGIPRRPDDGA